MKVCNLRCESICNPMGITIPKPRLTWNLESDRRGTYQMYFSLSIEEEAPDKSRRPIYASGRVNSGEAAYVPKNFSPESGGRYFWTVEVIDDLGNVSTSEEAWFEMGLLNISDWQAQWIEPKQTPVYLDLKDTQTELPWLRTFDGGKRRWVYEPDIDNYIENGAVMPLEIDENILYPSPLLRKTFTAKGRPIRARAYATAHGLYRMELNGERVGDYEFAPELTVFDKYLQVQTYDVTHLIKPGKNALGVALADGWYAGRVGFAGESCKYGDRIGFLCQIHMIYADGSEEILGTDGSFVSSLNGPRRYADIYIGEKYDSRMEIQGWADVTFDATGWTPVNVVDFPLNNLVGQNAQPMRVLGSYDLEKTYISPKGEKILDFGQVMAGNAVMHLKGMPGATVRLKYFEEPDREGNYRHVLTGYNSQMIDTVILGADGQANYEPWFTFHGYRYICVESDRGDVEISGAVARLIASDINVTASIATSNEKLNKLQKNIEWTIRSNMLSVLTDNPDRERAGWTGDTQMIAPTVCDNVDAQAIFRRWLVNCACDQSDNGDIPGVVPDFHLSTSTYQYSIPGWADVVVILPWQMYQIYGDKRILEDSWPMMVKWLEQEQYRACSANPVSVGEITPEREEYLKYIWNADFNFGDWVTPSACKNEETGEVHEGALALCDLAGTYYFAYSTQTMAKIARVLGKQDEAEKYEVLNRKIREAAIAELYNRGHILESKYMGAPILALHMGLCPEEARPKLFQRVLDLIDEKGMDTGFSSTLVLPELLCSQGHTEQMYAFMLNEQYPSWLYEVNQGATSVWETMQAIEPDGRMGDCSFIQPAYCSIGHWMVEGMCGIAPAQPGYRQIVIHPRLSKRLDYAGAKILTEQGIIENRWERQNGQLTMDTVIPANTTAYVLFANTSRDKIYESKGDLDGFEGLMGVDAMENGIRILIGSGDYHFRWIEDIPKNGCKPIL